MRMKLVLAAAASISVSLLAGQPNLSRADALAPAAPREGFVQAESDVQLYYRVEGGGADTLVVLHGGPGLHSGCLAPDLTPLEKTHTLIYYDQRGAGRSTLVHDAERLSLNTNLADLEAVRRHFHLGRMTLVGHSWGAGLAAHYAREHPDRVARLVLVDSMPPRRTPYIVQFNERLTAWMDDSTQARFGRLSAARKTATDANAACRDYWRLFLRGYFSDPSDSTLVTHMKSDVCNVTPEALRNASFVTQSTLKPLGDWDWRDHFHAVQAPVLVVHGEKDPIPVESASEWQAQFPNAKLVVIPGAGHFSYVERPADFFPAVEAFLKP